jgi:DNA-binding LytR/AlgR family response regulator
MNLDKVIFRTRRKIYFIDPFKIVSIRAVGSYVLIVCDNDEEIKVSQNLKLMMTRLACYDFLIKVHRSWVINVKYIKSLNSIINQNGLNKNVVLLQSGAEIPIVIKERHTLLNINDYKLIK